MGRRLKYTFFQRRHTNGREAHEKMFNIVNHHMNANLNHNEVLSYTYQKGYDPKGTEVTNVGEHEDMICTLLLGMSIGAATMDNSKEGPQNLKRELPNDPAIPLLGVYLKKKKEPTNLDGLRQVLDACLSLRVSTARLPFPSNLIYSLPVSPPQSNFPVY